MHNEGTAIMGTPRLSNMGFGAFKPYTRKPPSTQSSPSRSPVPQGPIPSPSPEPQGPSRTNSPVQQELIFFYNRLMMRKEANLLTLNRISPISRREIDQKELQLEQEQVAIITLLVITCTQYCDPTELQPMANPTLLAMAKVNRIIDEIKGAPSRQEEDEYEKARVIVGQERNKLEKELRKFLEEQEDNLDNCLKQSFTSLRAREDYSKESEEKLYASAETALNDLDQVKKSIKEGAELSHGLIIKLDTARLKFVTEKIQLEANLTDYLETPVASKATHFRV